VLSSPVVSARWELGSCDVETVSRARVFDQRSTVVLRRRQSLVACRRLRLLPGLARSGDGLTVT